MTSMLLAGARKANIIMTRPNDPRELPLELPVSIGTSLDTTDMVNSLTAESEIKS